MNIQSLAHSKDEYGNVYIGPIDRKTYEELKEYLSGLAVGYSASIQGKGYIITTSVKQLARGGIIMESLNGN